MTKKLQKDIDNLPSKPGVYLFKDTKGVILYVGKANNIKKRVKSHFSKQDNSHTLVNYSRVSEVDFIITRTEKNALVLERSLVQKYQPRYNIELKDDKNFFFVSFSNDALPKVSLTHQPRAHAQNELIGPFVYGKEFKTYLKNLRRIFPYRTCRNKKDNPCLYYHLGLCNAHLEKSHTYPLVIEGLKTFLKLYAGEKTRLEAYDISNTQGSLSVGSMVSFKNGKPDKDMYRKFKIKTVTGSNDPSSLKEIVNRRLSHTEWDYPNLIVVDGGKTQLSAFSGISIPTIALAKLGTPRVSSSLKKSTRRSNIKGILWTPYAPLSLSITTLPPQIQTTLLSLRNEAHRFAIAYHRKRRMKDLRV